MATLHIEVTPSDGLQRYELKLDDNPNNIELGVDNKGSVEAPGACGDGSTHHLYYALFGPIGSKLRLKIKCDETIRVNIPLEIFGPAVVESGDVEFTL